MSLIRAAVIVSVLGVGAWMLVPHVDSPDKRADSLAKMKALVSSTPTPPTKITVYQSTGHKGEATFADARHDQGRGQARVVDNSKGNTFHSVTPDEHDNERLGKGPLSKLERDQLKFQQRAAELRQAQIDRAIGE